MDKMDKRSLFNLEAEQSVLGCVLIGDIEAKEQIFATLKGLDFYDSKNKIIYGVMQYLFNNGKDIDFVTLLETLTRQNAVESVGGVEYVSNLTNIVPSASGYLYYIKIVKDYSKLRELTILLNDTQQLIEEGSTATNIQVYLQDKINNLIESEINKEVVNIGEIVDDEVAIVKDKINGVKDDFGLPTGYKDLDYTLWGLQPSDLIVIAARAGMGKTAFCLNILNHLAIEKKKKCLFFNLEMPKKQILQRLIAINSGIDNSAIKSGKNINFEKFKVSAEKVKNGALFIDDTSKNTCNEMFLKANRFKRKNGLDLVVVDYLQFINPNTKSGNRFQDVGEIARDLKKMARQLNVPVVALCQLNRSLDTSDREPTLADLRESGEIENNADIVMFLHKAGKMTDDVRKIDLIIGKFRNGALVKKRFEFQGKTFRFNEISKPQEEKKDNKILQPIEDDDLPF